MAIHGREMRRSNIAVVGAPNRLEQWVTGGVSHARSLPAKIYRL
jgi:hypothetical protein